MTCGCSTGQVLFVFLGKKTQDQDDCHQNMTELNYGLVNIKCICVVYLVCICIHYCIFSVS